MRVSFDFSSACPSLARLPIAVVFLTNYRLQTPTDVINEFHLFTSTKQTIKLTAVEP